MRDGESVTGVVMTAKSAVVSWSAATACGANGLEIEVHDDPSHAWSDGAQALTPDQFDDTMRRIRAIREVVCQETVQE